MNWTDQMQSFMRTWNEAQQNMASEWMNAVNRATAPGGATTQDWTARWREQAASAFENYLTGMAGVSGEASRRMFTGTQAYNQFVEFVSTAMRGAAPGANWAEGMDQYLKTIRQLVDTQPRAWMKPEVAAAAAGDMGELWQLFLKQAQALWAPWGAAFEQAQAQMGPALGGDHQAAVRLANLAADTFHDTVGKVLGTPTIGYAREHQEKLNDTFRAWAEMKRAEAAFNTELMTIGLRAMERFVAVLRDKALAGEKIESARKLFDLWVDVAEKTFFEAASTDAFARTQADLLNAAMRHKVCEKALVAEVYKAVHLPTRQELDDAYKHLHELRGQVKRLTKTVTALQADLASLTERSLAGAAAPAAAKKPAPRRKAAARPATKPAAAARKTTAATNPQEPAKKTAAKRPAGGSTRTPAKKASAAARTKTKEA